VSEPNDCPRLMESHRLWEGELEGRHAAEVRRHLADCSTCRAASGEWDRLSGVLQRGDPVAAWPSERQQRLKADLLAACAATLEKTGDTPQRAVPRSSLWPWRMPIRAALTLVPLALAALWFVHLGRKVSSPTQRLDLIGSRPEALSPIPGSKSGSVRDETHLRGFGSTNPRPTTSNRLRGLSLAQTGISNPGAGRPRARHFHHTRGVLSSPVAAVRKRPRDAGGVVPRPRRARRFASTLLPQPPVPRRHHSFSLVAAPAAPPTERLVIQVDVPPPAPVRTVTHLTVIAAGDLKAPGAQLAIVKTQKEEALP
jgi:hypothetical protein